jgi:hypothetical protein
MGVVSHRIPGRSAGGDGGSPAEGSRYRWVALSNTTLSIMMAMIDGSIVINDREVLGPWVNRGWLNVVACHQARHVRAARLPGHCRAAPAGQGHRARHRLNPLK